MGQVLDAFYRNAVVFLVAVAALGALCVFIGQTTPAAFLFMLLGLLIVLWDAHTDPNVPPAPSL
jgi:hypothetical protein